MARSPRVVIAALMAFAALFCMAQGRPGNKATSGLVASIPAINTNGLILWYRLDDNSTTTISDSSGNGYSGILSNSPASTLSVTNQSVQFVNRAALVLNGTGQCARLNNPAFKTNRQGTVMCRFRVTGSPSSQQQIINMGNLGSGGSEYTLSAAYRADLSKEIRFNCLLAGSINAPGFGSLTRTNIIPASDSSWHHLALVATSSSNQLYIDGIQEPLTVTTGATTGQWFAAISGATNLTFGAYHTGIVSLNGNLDDCRVYDRVLSSNEIFCIGTTNKPRTGGLQ